MMNINYSNVKIINNLKTWRTNNGMVADIPSIPHIQVVNHRPDTCRRPDCGEITAPS